MSAARVVVVGSANTDLTAYLPRLPTPGETVLAARLVTSAGGKGSNQAVAAARLGAHSALIARVGDDGLADVLRETWAWAGLDARHVRVVAGVPTGTALISVQADGENTIVVVPGANAVLSSADVDAALSTIMGAHAVLAQLEVPLDVVQHALARGRAAGTHTLLNPAPATALDDGLLALADVVTPNARELAALTGIADVPTAARALAGRTGGAVVVTQGGAGALVHAPDGTQAHVAAFPVAAIDAVGAGDVFSAALAVALSDGQPLVAAVRFACAAAAVAVTREGAARSAPSRAEVEALLG